MSDGITPRPLRELEYRLRAEASLLYREPKFAATMREAADELEKIKKAFKSLVSSVERAGFEVHHDLAMSYFEIKATDNK